MSCPPKIMLSKSMESIAILDKREGHLELMESMFLIKKASVVSLLPKVFLPSIKLRFMKSSKVKGTNKLMDVLLYSIVVNVMNTKVTKLLFILTFLQKPKTTEAIDVWQ